MPDNTDRTMQKPGTATGVSRRLFLRAAAAGAVFSSAGSSAVAFPDVRSSANAINELQSAGLPESADLAQSSGLPEYEGVSESDYWVWARRQFLISDDPAYMNSGTLGPTPKSVYDALVHGYGQLAAEPGLENRRQEAAQEKLREMLAGFVNARPGEVALTRNTTEGMSFVANGLDLKAGDEVLCSFHEHPGGLEPWRLRAKRHGVVVRELEFPIPTAEPADILNRFEDAITLRTRVISVSHITWPTGCMLPVKALAALARPRGILTVVDGAHALGMLALDLNELGADFYASSPYKWLGAPVGTGFLYLREESQQRLWPTVATLDWDDPEGGARRYDRLSQRAGPLIQATIKAIELQRAIGRQRIEQRVRALAARLRERLEEIPAAKIYTSGHPQLHCGLTGFTLDGFDREKVVDALWERHKVWVRETDMGLNTVRASTHYYNTEAQVDRLAEGLRDIVSRGLA